MTVKVAVPAAVNRLAGTVAVIEVAELAVMFSEVVTLDNVQLTTGDVVAKLVPVSVRLNVDCPTVAAVWLRVLSTGFGLIVKV